MIKRIVLFSAAALVLVSGAPASAQLDPLRDPLPRTLGEPIDQRLDRVEQTLRELRAILYQGRDTGRPVVVQPAETAGQLEIMNRRVNDLQDTLQRINNQLDSLSADIAGIRRDSAQDANASRAQAQALAEMGERLAAVEARMSVLDATEQARNEDPETTFNRGVQLLAEGRVDEAETALQIFLSAHPDDELVPEANYYVGEARFRRAAFNDAARAYLASIREWPDTPWAPDAVVKLAEALIETGRNADACGVLNELGNQYPDASPPIRSRAGSVRARARCG